MTSGTYNATRIAITGLGVVTPIGQGITAYWANLLQGCSGISEIERFPTDDLRVRRGGEIKKIDCALPMVTPLPTCRASQLLIHAATEALTMAGLIDLVPTRLGVVIGSALGGIEEAERFADSRHDVHALAGAPYDGPPRNLARWLRATGPVISHSTACASGATSVGMGVDLLRSGAATAVVAGGADVLCRFVMRGFNHLRSLTREEMRPFDRRRKGLLLGEGAGVVVLEREDVARARGAVPYGYVLGYASCADGSHITAPDPLGRGLTQAMRLALQQANVLPAAIDFISTHGTGTIPNDRMETLVFKRVLGQHAYKIPMNSIKAHMGHTMGAAAILEIIMCLLAGRFGKIPPTLNYSEADPDCDLDYVPGQARMYHPHLSLKTAAGFGGCNACVVLQSAE